MFDRDTDYPTAVASYDDEGVAAAIDWCVERMQTGDTLSVWTAVKSNLSNCDSLKRLVQQHGDVVHITGRGGGTPRGTGPVLMAWPDVDDIGSWCATAAGSAPSASSPGTPAGSARGSRR